MSSVVLAQLLDANPERKKQVGRGGGRAVHYFSMTDGPDRNSGTSYMKCMLLMWYFPLVNFKNIFKLKVCH